MGQYHRVVNLTKREFINCYGIDNGAKLREQVGFPASTSTALFALLACSNARGGGDFPDHSMVGKWAGDEIAIVGDYSEPEDIFGHDAPKIFSDTSYALYPDDWAEGDYKPDHEYTDITADVRDMMTVIAGLSYHEEKHGGRSFWRVSANRDYV